MFTKPIFILSLLLFSGLGTVYGENSYGGSNPLLESGINSYQKGNFDDAKANFIQLLSEPPWHFAALYNLGNVAVRQKHFGEALGYYKRAFAKKPHDSDVIFNLHFVEDSLGNRRFAGKISNYEVFRNYVLTRFGFSEFLALTLIFSFLFLFSLVAYIRQRRLVQNDDPSPSAVPPPSVFVMGLLLLLFLTVSAVKLYDTYSERGTILTSNVDLRSGPNESNASMQQIQEGTEVMILDSSADWKQVSLLNGGLAGWIPSKDVMVTSGGGPF